MIRLPRVLKIISEPLFWLGRVLLFPFTVFLSVFTVVSGLIFKIVEGFKKVNGEPKKKRGRPKRVEIKKSRRLLGRYEMFTLGFLASVVFIFIPYEIFTWFRSLPKADMVVVQGMSRPTRIYDRNNKLLYEIYVDRRYAPVKLPEIPELMKNATLAVEDAQFYNHKGIRLESILRAARETLFQGNVQGGSTITQQLIKNVLLTPERTVSRKLKEIILALFVEAKYSKDEIFELYLNNISYGGTAWGVQSAAQKYFGKNVWELDLAEISMIAGLPSAPSAYSPLTDLGLAKERQRYVLNRMYELGYITKNEVSTAYDEELSFANEGDFMKAPHFVQFVRKELERMYGKRFVEYGGLSVVTTLDLDLQENVQKIVSEEVEKSKGLNLTNGAAVVLDVPYAGILAQVGSIDYYAPGFGAYDVATAFRQPGSSIKPITYALALKQGFTPATIIKDSPITFQVPGSRPYSPVNYDGKYHGDVTVRTALANSYNVPAVRLAQVLGPDNIVSLGKDMGLTNWKVDGTYGLSITLGGKEVRLLDITNAFATFGRGGIYKQISPFLSIKDSRGYEIYNEGLRPKRDILGKDVSYLMWNILSDNNARTPAFGFQSSLVIPGYKVAVKTGTTDSKRDNWTIGFTPSYAIGVWVGNNDNTPMNQYLASGLTGAAPIWNRVTRTVLEGKLNEEMPMPGGVFVKTDSACGRSEVFIKGSNVPQRLCAEKKDEKKDKDKEKKKD